VGLQEWRSVASERFYPDIAGEEAAGGSMLRVLKFYQRGYRIPLDSLGAVITRLVDGVDFEKVFGVKSVEIATLHFERIITSLLQEVDPMIDPDHIAHLPSADEVADDMESDKKAAE
jgi:hypothetical protein